MSSQRAADRRNASERRLSSDRRKPSDGRCAIIEVCRSMLHLALVARNANSDDSGDRVVTRSIRWRKEANSLHTEQGIIELTEAFRTLVAEEHRA
jgi:hypothetical protein